MYWLDCKLVKMLGFVCVQCDYKVEIMFIYGLWNQVLLSQSSSAMQMLVVTIIKLNHKEFLTVVNINFYSVLKSTNYKFYCEMHI